MSDKDWRRRKVALIGVDFFLEFAREGWQTQPDEIIKTVQGVPEDAQYIAHDYWPTHNAIALIFQHPDWPIVELASEYEIILVWHEKVKLTRVE